MIKQPVVYQDIAGKPDPGGCYLDSKLLDSIDSVGFGQGCGIAEPRIRVVLICVCKMAVFVNPAAKIGVAHGSKNEVAIQSAIRADIAGPVNGGGEPEIGAERIECSRNGEKLRR